MADNQLRPDLALTVQQFASTPMAQVLAQQIETFSAAGTMAGRTDLALCDATAGAFILTLPAASQVVLGKPYTVKEISGIAAITVDAAGAGTIDGSANLTVPLSEAAVLVPTAIAAGLVTWRVLSQTAAPGGDSSAIHVNVAGEIAGITTKAAPVAADIGVLEDSAAANVKKKFTLGSIPVAQAQVVSIVLQPAADAAVAILSTTGGIQLTVTGAGNVAISTSSSYAGQKLDLFALAVAGGGSYTLALDVGTLTLNAASESARVQRNAANTAWICTGLSGATIV